MVGLIKFFKRIVALLLIPLVLAFILQAYFSITGNVAWQDLTWMLVGLVGYFIIYIVLYSWNLQFIEIFEHEFIHAITAFLTLRKLREFRVFPEEELGNYVRTFNGSNFLVTLAPYFLPILTIPMLVVRFFVPDSAIPAVDTLIGITLGFHYAALAKEFSRIQPDIKKQTLPFSVVITLLFNTVILVLVISVVVDNLRLTLDYLREAFARSFDYYSFIAAWIAQFGILAKLQEVVALLSA